MQIEKVLTLFMVVILAECSRNVPRHDLGISKKDSHFKMGKRARGEVLENLFNIYDPSFLSLVWPKISNGVHLLIEQTCWDDISVFYRHLSEGRAWAYKAVDATGRYRSSIFNGDRFWLGSKEQCLRMDNNFMTRRSNETYEDLQNIDYVNAILRREKYFDSGINDWRWKVHRDELTQRTVVADNRPPYSLAYSTIQVALNITKLTMAKSYDVTLGVCLPRSCTPEDIKSIINFSILANDNLKSNRTIPRTAKITYLRLIEGYFDITKDTGAILLICITLSLVLLSVVATVLDLDLKCLPYNTSTMSFDLPKYDNEMNRFVDEAKYPEAIQNNVKDAEKFANMNLVAMMVKPNEAPPTITLDVVPVERQTGSCKRCGKYKKQCNNSRQVETLQACPRVKYNSFASLSTDDNRRNNICCKLLLCFSLTYCWKRIFNKNTANRDLSVVHALKIFATFWVIFVHVTMIVNYISNSSTDVNERNNAYFIVATGTIAFDTLFFASGVFSSHHFFYLKSRYTVQELVNFSGLCGQVLQFVCFVTNRIIRLVPSYAFSVFLTSILARAMRTTSSLVLPDSDYSTCDQYWWRNLLYITTLYPDDERCMQISWFLTTETQLHVVGALLCAVSMSDSMRGDMRGRLVAALALAVLLAATAADVSAAYVHYGKIYTNVYTLYSTMIERPWARVAPYFIGVFTGWLVHNLHGKCNVSKVTSSLLWLASLSLLVASLAVAWLPHAWISAWVHLAWPVALLWPALICSTNYSSSFRAVVGGSSTAALSRLSYTLLLLHAPLANYLLLSIDSALCDHTLCIWMYFAGTSLACVCAALVVSLLVEMPSCSLLRTLSDCAV